MCVLLSGGRDVPEPSMTALLGRDMVRAVTGGFVRRRKKYRILAAADSPWDYCGISARAGAA
jgi:hypothetical protein